MLRHYIVHFVRNLQRQRLFSFINLLGLTVTIACTLLIYLYVRHEFSYDRFHKNADRIYRINQTFIWGENSDNQFASTGPGVAYAVKAEVPEVELITSIHTPGNFIISYTTPSKEIIAFEEDKVLAADTNFFKMFNFPFVRGNAASALQQANTLVMTESTAQKYFGEEDPIGKLVRLGGLNGNDQKTYEVTSVVKDTPDNSYIEFDVLLSMKSFPIDKLYWSWIWTQLETYVLLDAAADIENGRARLAPIPRKHAEQTLQWVMNTTFDDYIKSGKKWELFLQPMTRIHLPSETVLNRLNDSGNIKIIYSLIGAAVVIVLLSCVNFMNLSTAQFTRRIKGKLKVGREGKSFRNGLVVFQFSVSIALMISTVIVFEQLNYVSEKDLDFNKENLLVLKHVEGVQNGESMANAAMHAPGVVQVSWCTSLPPTIGGGDKFSAEDMNGNTFSLNYTSGDEQYIPTLDIKLKFGRNFSPDAPGNINKVILNETAIKKIGWNLDESVIGKKLEYPNSNEARFEVVGVVADFNYWSLETPIEPMAIFHIKNKNINAGDRQFIALRISAQNSNAWQTTFATPNKVWKEHAGDTPFEYAFADA